jgi:PAS domain-containing protein
MQSNVQYRGYQIARAGLCWEATPLNPVDADLTLIANDLPEIQSYIDVLWASIESPLQIPEWIKGWLYTPTTSRIKPGLQKAVAAAKVTAIHIPTELAEISIVSSVRAVRSMIAKSAIGAYITDTHGVITYANEAADDFIGRRTLVGEDMWNPSWRLWDTEGQGTLAHDCATGRSYRARKPIRDTRLVAERPDRSWGLFNPVPSLMRSKTGAFLGMVNVMAPLAEGRH